MNDNGQGTRCGAHSSVTETTWNCVCRVLGKKIKSRHELPDGETVRKQTSATHRHETHTAGWAMGGQLVALLLVRLLGDRYKF